MSSAAVSIIIPCFDSAEHVGEAISSALSQSYANKEVVIIDDGSRDESLDVIKSFGHSVRWETGPNRGACAARNRGIELAKGELIQFLDSDDLLHPEKLGQMVPVAIRKGGNHIVVCDWETVETNDTEAESRYLSFPEDHADEVVWCTHYSLATGSPLHWKSNLVKVGGFDESLCCSQERDLHLRLACHGLHFVHLPKVLVRIRRRSCSLSSDSLKVLRQHLYIAQKADRLLKLLNRQTNWRSAALAGLLARDARVLLQGGLVEDAHRYFQVARAMHRSGGLDLAYRPLHKIAARLMGPELFERLVALKRSVRTGLDRTRDVVSSA